MISALAVYRQGIGFGALARATHGYIAPSQDLVLFPGYGPNEYTATQLLVDTSTGLRVVMSTTGANVEITDVGSVTSTETTSAVTECVDTGTRVKN